MKFWRAAYNFDKKKLFNIALFPCDSETTIFKNCYNIASYYSMNLTIFNCGTKMVGEPVNLFENPPNVVNTRRTFCLVSNHCWSLRNQAFFFRSSRSQMFFKMGVLKNFAIFTGKHLCWYFFLIKLQVSTTLLKRGSNISDFPVDLAKSLRTALFAEHL